MEIQIGSFLTVSQAFELAIVEAKKGLGWVAPNPLVGCVVLDKQGRLLGKGYHQKFGGPHAEVNALASIKDPSLLKGAQVIVTLEPCSHFGKTPPCAELLLKFPLSKVHYGILDPNPKVSGQGLAKLKANGIEVEPAPPEIAEKIKILMECFLTNMEFSEPFIDLKIASSLDGQMAMASGESQWITSPLARQKGQLLRAKYGCVLTSAKTLMRDDSQLNCRVEPFQNKEISIVVLDRRGESANWIKHSRAYALRSPSSIFIASTREGLSKFDDGLGLNKILADEKDGHLNLHQVIQKLWIKGIHSILVEGGPQLSSAFLKENLFHRLSLFLGNKILGQDQQQGWSSTLQLKSLDQAFSLNNMEVENLDGSILISGRNPLSLGPVLS